ncbi:glucose-6-phosphate isomerase [Rhizobiaceae bacterium n13]|uniref:Glucose-6-phosphate isomerase n=1 Tax=Ferirhizobium litorale TaxID=2927786 RepID=A0AAE3U1K0_9HYPH|nr:glucose-6-phosphate isomerase [Fererhizobium litorale]MDI7862245.1 glucose-6-phosphate isomerase [Fererhizobium litorale]MDI7922481.1 glucose-6-phosphate isomerase [Fererhizobium litorale]
MKAIIDQLKTTAAATRATDIRAAFASDPGRFDRYSARLDDLLMDYSKSAVNAEVMALLLKLADEGGVAKKRDAMFAGEAINFTENRAVLHTALRNRSNTPVLVDGKDVMPEVNDVLAAMGRFADAIRSGAIKGATGKKITDVVNIGIGGSDLGPVMATLALGPYHDGPRLHFVSNIDGAHIADTLKLLAADTTLFIVASKTFTTIETMTNAATARRFIADALGEAAVGHHFAAVSTALDKVAAFGIDSDRIFGFWDWVGGRYSIWSAIGLPLMIAIGPENFGHFLDGAHAMDNHFRSAPTGENLPMLLGLIGYYERNVLGYPSRAVIPYDQRLARFPAYLQQLDMESNGKGVTIDGTPVNGSSGPVVWGEPGTNGQHAFFQLLHQGTDIVPVEFMIAANGFEPELRHQHQLLMANCLAQSEALMKGRTVAEAKAQLTAKGMDDSQADFIAPHRVFTGNRPSITFVHDRLTPYALGRLIALYEHRVFVEGVLFRINSFDQWGVELGKELATGLLPVIEGKESASSHDSSTQGLVAALAKLAK